MPNGVSPSAPWDEKKSPQEKPIQQKDMLTDITSIFRREEYSTNTNCFTSQKAKECSVLPIEQAGRQDGVLEIPQTSFVHDAVAEDIFKSKPIRYGITSENP